MAVPRFNLAAVLSAPQVALVATVVRDVVNGSQSFCLDDVEDRHALLTALLARLGADGLPANPYEWTDDGA